MQHAEARPLEIGGILRRAFAMIGQFPLRIFGVAFVLGGMPIRLVYYAISVQIAHGWPRSLVNLETAFLSEICETIAAGLLIGGLVRNEPGITSGLRRLPQLIAVGFLKAFGCMLAAAALLIPYFFVATRWSVVGAVAANEDTGINAAFGRSSELTEGLRLGIFGLLILSAVGRALLFILSVGLLAPVTGAAVAMQDFTLQPAVFSVQLLVETLTIAFTAALQCALYTALRERREGPMTDHLTEIFA